MSTGVSTGPAKEISARRGLRKPRAGVGLLSTRRTKCQLPTPFARGAKMDDLYVFHPKVAEYDGSWAQRAHKWRYIPYRIRFIDSDPREQRGSAASAAIVAIKCRCGKMTPICLPSTRH